MKTVAMARCLWACFTASAIAGLLVDGHYRASWQTRSWTFGYTSIVYDDGDGPEEWDYDDLAHRNREQAEGSRRGPWVPYYEVHAQLAEEVAVAGAIHRAALAAAACVATITWFGRGKRRPFPLLLVAAVTPCVTLSYFVWRAHEYMVHQPGFDGSEGALTVSTRCLIGAWVTLAIVSILSWFFLPRIGTILRFGRLVRDFD